MNITENECLLNLLTGINANNFGDATQIYWCKTNDLSALKKELLSSNIDSRNAYIFGNSNDELVDAQLFGDFGFEGDEAVLSSGIIVETCSYSGLPYLNISGLTYISFESEADGQLLRETLEEFRASGFVAPSFLHPALITELAALTPNTFALQRFVVDSAGISPYKPSEVIERVRNENPQLAHYFVSAVLMGRLLNAAEKPLQVDLPQNLDSPELEGILFGHRDSEYYCMNIATGKIYQLGFDMYRAALSVLDPAKYEKLDGEEITHDMRDKVLKNLQNKVFHD